MSPQPLPQQPVAEGKLRVPKGRREGNRRSPPPPPAAPAGRTSWPSGPPWRSGGCAGLSADGQRALPAASSRRALRGTGSGAAGAARRADSRVFYLTPISQPLQRPDDNRAAGAAQVRQRPEFRQAGRASPVGFPPTGCFCGDDAVPRPAAGPIRGLPVWRVRATSDPVWGQLGPVPERRARSAWFPPRRSVDPNSIVLRRRDRKAPAP